MRTVTKFHDASSMQSRAQSTYGDQYAYSYARYDILGRPVSMLVPGQAWHSANKCIRKTYDTNAASYFDALFYRPVRDADWDLARKAFGEATDLRFGSKQSLWGLATGTLFGVLAVDKFISVPKSALYGVIR